MSTPKALTDYRLTRAASAEKSVFLTDDIDIIAKFIHRERTHRGGKAWEAEEQAARRNRLSIPRFAPDLVASCDVPHDPMGNPGPFRVFYFETYSSPLRHYHKKFGRLSPLATKKFLDTVSVMHACGIAHRDIHPDNIVLLHDRSGEVFKVRLIDFESALFFNFKTGEPDITYERLMDLDAITNSNVRLMLCAKKDRI